MSEQLVCPKEAAARDAADIAATLADFEAKSAAPVVKPMKSKPTAKPARMMAPDTEAGARCDDDDDGFTPSNVGNPKPVVSAPAPKPVDPADVKYAEHGYPDLSCDADLIRVRENIQRLEALVASARELVQESCGILGVLPHQHKPGKIEETIERLLANGGDVSAVEQYDERCRQLRRLEGALALAKKEIHPTHEAAVRKLLPFAREVLRPSVVAAHRARVEYVRKMMALDHDIRRMGAAGFPNDHSDLRVCDAIPRYADHAKAEFTRLVAEGWLTHEEVADLVE